MIVVPVLIFNIHLGNLLYIVEVEFMGETMSDFFLGPNKSVD